MSTEVDYSGGVPARIPDPPPEPEKGRIKKAWAWWLTKAAVIAKKQNRVFAWLAFYMGLSGVGLFMRRKDKLDRDTKPVGETGWHVRTDPIHTDIDRVRRPV